MPKKIDAPEENPGTKRITGTFSAPPPLCINDVFSDRRNLDARHKGKQILGGVYKVDEKTRLCAPGAFKLQPFLFASEDMKGKEPYKENVRYIAAFPNGDARPRGAPKCGFLSSDFARRDQYSNTIATEQARTVFRTERKLMKKAQEEQKIRFGALGLNRPATAGRAETGKRLGLFDLVYRKPDLGHLTQRLHRDDRQAKFFYMANRGQSVGGSQVPTTAKVAPRLDDLIRVQRQNLSKAEGWVSKQDGAAVWVSAVLPNGHQMLVQLDASHSTILDRRPTTA